MQFDDNYLDMMRAGMKAAGMSDDQIDATIQMQKASMGAIDINPADIMAAANTDASALVDQLSAMNYGADEDDFRYVEKPSVNESYQWAIACGADLAHLRGDILNDLNTDEDTSESGEILENDWDITSHDDAVEMCDSLLGGHHSLEYNQASQDGAGDDIENVRAAEQVFVMDGLIKKGAIPNMLIWDLGRLVTVCRLAFDAGLLSRDEALKYLRELAKKVQTTYKSWREMSVAYQFGRAVWGGIDEDEYQIMKSNMDDLLSSTDSPWNKMPFDMKLAF